MLSAESTPQPAQAAAGPTPSMSLSVVLPNFNHGALIPRALRALLRQTPAALEIIVVDDGSTDDSVTIIEGFVRQYPSVRLIRHASNKGIVAAVKTALDVAGGEYLLFASADDFVLPGLFSHALAGLSRNPEAAFFCSSVALLDAGNRVLGVRPFTPPRLMSGYLSPKDVRRAIRGTDFWVIGTSTVYRRRFLAEVGYFDERLGSIGDTLTNRLLAFRHGFYFDSAVLAAYNKDPKSFSGRSALSVQDSLRLLDAAGTWIAEKLPEDVRDEHRGLFDRRMRFGFARLWVLWRSGWRETDAIADILNFGAFDRRVLAALSRIPKLSAYLMLGWMTLRMRPFSLRGVAEAWCRDGYFKWFRHATTQRQINKMIGRDAVSPGSDPQAATRTGT